MFDNIKFIKEIREKISTDASCNHEVYSELMSRCLNQGVSISFLETVLNCSLEKELPQDNCEMDFVEVDKLNESVLQEMQRMQSESCKMKADNQILKKRNKLLLECLVLFGIAVIVLSLLLIFN